MQNKNKDLYTTRFKNNFRFILWAFVMLAFGAVHPAKATTGTPCGHGGGTILELRNHAQYCVSLKGMNWWSAFAWCDAAGGRLASVNEICYDTSLPEDAPCPNLKFEAEEYRLWTSSSETKDGAVFIYAKSGNIASFSRSYVGTIRAFCKL